MKIYLHSLPFKVCISKAIIWLVGSDSPGRSLSQAIRRFPQSSWLKMDFQRLHQNFELFLWPTGPETRRKQPFHNLSALPLLSKPKLQHGDGMWEAIRNNTGKPRIHPSSEAQLGFGFAPRHEEIFRERGVISLDSFAHSSLAKHFDTLQSNA